MSKEDDDDDEDNDVKNAITYGYCLCQKLEMNVQYFPKFDNNFHPIQK